MDDYIASNRELWNNWAQAHVGSEFYDVAGFKVGRNSLNAVELEEVGEVAGKSLLHLQCHFGLDTLSWARGGARVTGADLSDASIELARSLAAEVGIDAQFVRANLYDLPTVLDGQFDIVYTGGGVLYWLPDMKGWGEVIAHFLKPGGFFYLRDMHPIIGTFEEIEGKLVPTYEYFDDPTPLRFDTDGSYAGSFDYKGVEYGWLHSLSSIINALTGAGLRLDWLHEFPTLGWRMFPSMVQDEGGRWRLPGDKATLPLSFSLRVSK